MANKKRKKNRHVFSKVLLVLILVLGAMTIYSNYALSTSRYSPEFSSLPESFDGFRIVQLSDLHQSVFGNGNETLVARVSEEEPDIIVVTGDIIDDITELDYVSELMPKLTAIAPTYYVTGNHEWACGAVRDILPIMDENGVTVMRNDFELISRGGDAIVLAGGEDPNGRADMEPLDSFLDRVKKENGNAFTLCLYHRNYYLAQFAERGIDLVLSGHAHGGVIRLPFTDGLIGPNRELLPTYTSGEYTMGGTLMIVSRGIGHYVVPRMFNRPDIVSVTLRAK